MSAAGRSTCSSASKTIWPDSNFVWYHPVEFERTLRDLCTDAQGRCHGVAIPPHLVRREHIEHMPLDILLREVGASLADIPDLVELV
jgi:hypothetical protein